MPIFSKHIPRKQSIELPFITTWTTTYDGQPITLPLVSGYNYDFIVDWGDASPTDHITDYNQTERQHVYSTTGTYDISIAGICEAFSINANSSLELLINDIRQWGTVAWKTCQSMFKGCDNIKVVTATDTPNLNSCTSLNAMFHYCRDFNSNVSGWDTSNITNMQEVFFHCDTAFNQDLSGWDTSNVTTMNQMFYFCYVFDQPLLWDTGNVTNMYRMFLQCPAFDQDISGWDVSKVTNMGEMFSSVTLSTINYDALLIGWDAQNLQSNVDFGAGNSKYTAGAAAETARTNMITTDNWNITDGGSV